MTRSTPTMPLKEWLTEAPFTLAMSSGFFGFFAHTGALWALRDAGIQPAAVRGSSAGAMVTSLWAAGLEPDRIAAELEGLQREEFWDPRPGLGLLRGRLFDAKLRQLLPQTHVESCAVPVAISVFDVLGRRTEVWTHGELAPLIRASCALPGLFQPVWIGRRPKLDGGIADRPGLHGRVSDARTFYHHLNSTSPWRRRRGPGATVPEAPGLRSLAIPGLPRVSPFRLATGRLALAQARAAMARALQH